MSAVVSPILDLLDSSMFFRFSKISMVVLVLAKLYPESKITELERIDSMNC